MKTDQMDQEAEHDDRHVHITVTVNEKPVTFEQRHATGMQIKETAIHQGINIQRDFVLYRVKGPGHLEPIGDNEEVSLHPQDRFRATAPDDNS